MKLPIYHDWEPVPSSRTSTTFSSSSVRMEDHVGWVLTKNLTTGLYPTGGEHYVTLDAFAPTALRRWLALDVTVLEPTDEDLAAVTSVRFRLKAGASTYWWSGAAWAAPSSGNWNTLEEIQANLSTFLTTAKSLALVARLQTSDERYTPTLKGAGVAAEVVTKGQHYEVLYRGFVRRLKTLRPVCDFGIEWAATGLTHSIAAMPQEEDVTITSVVELYRIDTDPDLATDILASWNSGTSTITASASIPAGTLVVFRAQIQPTVAYTASPDYKVASRLPALQLSELQGTMVSQFPGTRAFVSRNDGSAVVVRRPRQLNLRLKLSGVASRSEEAFSLVEAALTSLRESPQVSLPELDEVVDVIVQGEIAMVPSFDETNTHRAEILVLVRAVNRWHESLAEGSGVTTVTVSGSFDAVLEG